jgi:hypothetical protein
MKLHTWEDPVWRRDPLERAHRKRLKQARQDARLDYLMDRMADPRFVGDQLTTKHLADVVTEMFEIDARRTDEGYGDVPAARMIHEFNEVVRAYQHEHYLAGTHAPMFFLPQAQLEETP